MNIKILKFLLLVSLVLYCFPNTLLAKQINNNHKPDTNQNILQTQNSEQNYNSSDLINNTKDINQNAKNPDSKEFNATPVILNASKWGGIGGLEVNYDQAFYFGLNAGFQAYFGSSQKNGIRTTAHMLLDTDGIDKKISLFKVGFDIKYLYDFYQKNNYTIGFNIGLGYQKYFYFDQNKYESSYLYKDQKESIKIRNYSIVGVVGIHLYYKHNQFELFSGYPNIIGATIIYRI